MAEVNEPVEAICPTCRRTEIVYIPKEPIPNCPDCRTLMVLRELLRVGFESSHMPFERSSGKDNLVLDIYPVHSVY